MSDAERLRKAICGENADPHDTSAEVICAAIRDHFGLAKRKHDAVSDPLADDAIRLAAAILDVAEGK